MAVFRFLAAVFLLVATIALVVDATPPLYGGGAFEATSLSTQWQELAPNSFEAARTSVSGLSPVFWDGVIARILGVPTFVTFGALAL
jgi:hypothetical protein